LALGEGFTWQGQYFYFDKLDPYRQPYGYFNFDDLYFQEILRYLDYITPQLVAKNFEQNGSWVLGARDRIIAEAKMLAHQLAPYVDLGKYVEIIIFVEINNYYPLGHSFIGNITDFVKCQADAIKAVDSRIKTAVEMAWGMGPGQQARFGGSDWDNCKTYFDTYLKNIGSIDDVVFTFYPNYTLKWNVPADRQLIIDDFTAIVNYIRNGDKGTWLSEFGKAGYEADRLGWLDLIYNYCVKPNNIPLSVWFQITDVGKFGLVR
jgi:hypothetical protein